MVFGTVGLLILFYEEVGEELFARVHGADAVV